MPGRFLGKFGILSPQPSSDLANKSFLEILGKVPEQGGIIVAAHVTNDNGFFKVLSGRSRIQAWQSDDLRAIQIPGQVDNLPQDVRQIVENRNADYRRTHAAEERLAVAVVNARDIVKPEDIEDWKATCWHCQRKTGLIRRDASCKCLWMKSPFRYFKTSPEIIRLAVMMYVRFPLTVATQC